MVEDPQRRHRSAVWLTVGVLLVIAGVVMLALVTRPAASPRGHPSDAGIWSNPLALTGLTSALAGLCASVTGLLKVILNYRLKRAEMAVLGARAAGRTSKPRRRR